MSEQELRARALFPEVLDAVRAYAGNSSGPIQPWRVRGEIADRLGINLAANTPQLRASFSAFSGQVLNALNKLTAEGFLLKAGKGEPGPDGSKAGSARFYLPSVWDRYEAQAGQRKAEDQAKSARWKEVASTLEQRGFQAILPSVRPNLAVVEEWARLAALLGAGTYTREQVSDAVSAAADETYGGDRANLFANLAMGWLDEPGATADEVIEEAYGEDPSVVRGWSGL